MGSSAVGLSHGLSLEGPASEDGDGRADGVLLERVILGRTPVTQKTRWAVRERKTQATGPFLHSLRIRSRGRADVEICVI